MPEKKRFSLHFLFKCDLAERYEPFATRGRGKPDAFFKPAVCLTRFTSNDGALRDGGPDWAL